jgi:N-sulfoglucosamine sulfohydrolase
MLWTALVVGAAAAASAAPGNVVLVVADDLGLDLACYGHPDVRTPSLDALAASGTRFQNAFCTTASCSASRSVILTGLHNHANGQYGHQHAEHNFHTRTSVRSLPVLLKQGGYRTCSIGKLHVQPESVYAFEEFANDRIPGGTHNPVAMANRAKEFISADDSRPFFLYFCPTDPHRAGKAFGNERTYPGVERVEYSPASIRVPPFLPDLPAVRADLAEYLQAVSRLDQGVGRLMEVLRETGHEQDTLVIFLSDNGSPFPGAKTNLYEPGMHLPLIVRAPGGTPGVVSEALVNWTDVVPTILEFAGMRNAEAAFHGRSFLGVLNQERPEGWDTVFASHTFHEVTMYYPMRVIRTRQYKLIQNVAWPLEFPFASDLYGSPTWQAVLSAKVDKVGRRSREQLLHRPHYELYDLLADPDETENLAERAEFKPVLNELQTRLRQWQEETQDPWVVKYCHE